MVRLEGIRIKNYRALRDITLGKLWNRQKDAPLTPLTVVIGKNGAGKSSLFDAFGFLGDCLRVGVEEACELQERGGFQRLCSQGMHDQPMEFEIYFRARSEARPITYELAIHLDQQGRPAILRERLRQRRKGQNRGAPFSFLYLQEGMGFVWAGLENVASEELEQSLGNAGQFDQRSMQESSDKLPIELIDRRIPGIVTLGALKEHPRITELRHFLGGWYMSYFSPNSAREISKAGPQKHLQQSGSNLGNVVQFLQREHPLLLKRILQQIAEKIPDITAIEPYRDEISKNLYLLFRSPAFKEPFTHYQMSDGTLKIFAYLLLLHDPEPPPFLCIEEPENGLYHKLLELLAREFRDYASKPSGAQLFVTTHQPYLVDALDPEEVWVLQKGEDGFAHIVRASSLRFVKSMVEEGQPLGGLWYSDYLEGR
ncbi:AAA family ATPase [Candidatus Magnetaquicoccus inordinatus]|uniref:AAA family ATPase n=1 Tax=Candidatus Magnetaquicoccus inordinatus TaxID=2496818 RepID=UPI00102ADDAC|nr:AAA family ATPase [Candidatus Magnetaquicoccus inordinatus]